MSEAPTPWIKPTLCDRCHKETKEVELVQLEKDFDSVKICTSCTHELVKKIERHRARHTADGRKMEVLIFHKFMDRYSYGYDSKRTLQIIVLIFVFIAFMIFIIGYMNRNL